MESPINRIRLALAANNAQRDLTLAEARQFDAAIAVRIDEAVARAGFSSAPSPDFAATSPCPHHTLTHPASRAQVGAHVRDQLREALAHLEEVLNAEQA